MNPGTMTPQWTVSCCDCTAWKIVSGTKRYVSAEVKKLGWTKQRKVWLCPTCTTLRDKGGIK